MHTHVLFEHPLNEKMRTWLRIEFLIQQLSINLPIADHAGALHFFRNISDLLDVFERGEVRTELLKELERQQRKLQAWVEVPGVDQDRIEALRQQLKSAGSVLISAPRIGQQLREDRLIALVASTPKYSWRLLQFRFTHSAYLVAPTTGAARRPD